jgi:type IV pilus assembly protein PilO
MKKTTSSLDSFEPVFEKIGQLSKRNRILICVAAFVLLVGCFFYFSYLPKIEKIKSLSNQKTTLEQQLATAKAKASQLASYREQMKKAQDDFQIAKAVLPETQEIPSLLSNISQSGQDAGLEFLLFQPKTEVKKDFYAEIPVDIKVSGSYHQVATFFDNVSRLYRIVNMQNIEMKSEKEQAVLATSCTAVTYKFVEEAETKAAESTKTTSRRTRKN